MTSKAQPHQLPLALPLAAVADLHRELDALRQALHASRDLENRLTQLQKERTRLMQENTRLHSDNALLRLQTQLKDWETFRASPSRPDAERLVRDLLKLAHELSVRLNALREGR